MTILPTPRACIGDIKMISSLFWRELGPRLPGDMVPELGWTPFELAGVARPLRNTLAGCLNRTYF